MQDNLKRQSALASHPRTPDPVPLQRLRIYNGTSLDYLSDIFPGEIVLPQSFKVNHSISGMKKLISFAASCVGPIIDQRMGLQPQHSRAPTVRYA